MLFRLMIGLVGICFHAGICERAVHTFHNAAGAMPLQAAMLCQLRQVRPRGMQAYR